MSMFPTRALRSLDAEVARLGRVRVWEGVRARWADEPLLQADTVGELLGRLRGTGAETDPLARRLVALAARNDEAALTVLLATLAGVFVATSRRLTADVDAAVTDQLSLAAEIVRTSELPPVHVLAVLVSRVHARQRRLRHRGRFQGDGPAEALLTVAAADDPARRALARVTLHEVGAALHREVDRGVFTQADWRRLVDLRVHERTSDELARRDAMSPAGVRKRVQRLAEAVAPAADAA